MPRIMEIDIIAFDLESTGLDTEEDRIVEFGATTFEGGRMKERGRVLVNPEKEISDEARKVHKISSERVARCPFWRDILPRVGHKFDEVEALVGYNCLRFDVPMMDAEAKRAGSTWRVPIHKVIDISVFVNWDMRGDRPRTQEAIAKNRFGIEPQAGQAHSAAVDTQMTGELLLAMVKGGYIPDDLDEALTRQNELRPVIEKEFRDWGPWLYRDRSTRRIRIGAGKHCGRLISDVNKNSFGWYLNNVDLTSSARQAFESAQAGRTQDEIQETLFNETVVSSFKCDDDHDYVDGWGG